MWPIKTFKSSDILKHWCWCSTLKLPVVATDLNKVTLHTHMHALHSETIQSKTSHYYVYWNQTWPACSDHMTGSCDSGTELLDLKLVSVACFWEEHQITTGCKQCSKNTVVSLETLGGSADQQVHHQSDVLRRPRFITSDLRLKWFLIGRLFIALIMAQSTETMCQLLLLFTTERPSVWDVTASGGKKANCSRKLKEVGGKHDSIVGK